MDKEITKAMLRDKLVMIMDAVIKVLPVSMEVQQEAQEYNYRDPSIQIPSGLHRVSMEFYVNDGQLEQLSKIMNHGMQHNNGIASSYQIVLGVESDD